MNLSIPKRFLIITAVIYIISFLTFLVYNFIQFEPKNIDLYFKNAWVFRESLLNFINSLITAQSTAVVFTFSVFFPKIKSESGVELLTSKNFNQLVTLVIVILLITTALFFSASEILRPRLYQKLDSYRYLTETSRTYLKHANEALEEGRLFDAEDLTQRYLAIKPGDEDGGALLQVITKRIDNQYTVAQSEADNTAGRPVTKELELDYSDAMRLARGYLNNQDYYSAYYYSRIASQLSGGAEDAKQLSSEAWTALSEIEPSKQESEAYSLYSEKKRGTELLLSDKPIEAYYLFNRLAINNPEDPDITKYLRRSIEETVKLTYFIDEAEKALNFPGIDSICFLNVNDDNIRELFFIGKMVNLVEGIFFKDIEVISFNPEQGLRSHITAPYGKLVGDHIVLNGIDRENKNLRIIPDYIVSQKIPDLYNTVKLNADSSLLHGLGSSENIYKKMSIIELYEFEPLIQDLGWPSEPLYIEIITRILNPCAFIIISLLMLALGWQYRRFEGKIPIAGFILSPVLVYIISLVTNAYIYGMRLLCAWLYLGFGKLTAISLLSVSQIILLLTAFLLIAGLKTTEEGA